VLPAPVPPPSTPGATPAPSTRTWYGALWGTLRTADQPPGQ
jgi:hypothetical protein